MYGVVHESEKGKRRERGRGRKKVKNIRYFFEKVKNKRNFEYHVRSSDILMNQRSKSHRNTEKHNSTYPRSYVPPSLSLPSFRWRGGHNCLRKKELDLPPFLSPLLSLDERGGHNYLREIERRGREILAVRRDEFPSSPSYFPLFISEE